MAAKKKPAGFDKFKALAKLLIQVPKEELEAVEATRKKRAPRKKK